MVINDRYEEQTRKLLSETQSELRAVEGEIDILRDRAAILAKEAQSLETVLDVHLKRTGRQVISQTDWRGLLKDEKNHKARLQAIAKHKGSAIKVSEATDILYTNGFINTKKRANAYIIVQANLADMEEKGIFEKTAPGEYRLVGAQQSLLS